MICAVLLSINCTYSMGPVVAYTLRNTVHVRWADKLKLRCFLIGTENLPLLTVVLCRPFTYIKLRRRGLQEKMNHMG